MLPKHTLCGSISWASAHTRSKFASLGGSVKADLAAHGFDELRGVVADAVLEDDLNLFDVFDIGRGISLQHDDVGCFAGSQRTNFIELAEEFGAVRRGDVNGLERREACLDEKFHFALVAESGDHAAVSCGIESREEQTAAFDEFAFELELLLMSAGQNEVAA